VNAYIDSSVVLRVILSAHDSLAEWNEIDQYAASALLRVECYRTIDRIRLMGQATEVEAASRQRSLEELLRYVNLIDVSPRVLQSASGSFPVPLKTLDDSPGNSDVLA
jgi:predicted  nucleic acid-binding Zn ribbon protein